MPPRKLPVRHGPTVLLVEDNEDIREALALYLGSEGFRVISVGDGSQAIASLGQIQVDVILTDYRLPDLLGTDVLEVAHTQYGMPPTAAVIVSGVHPLRGEFAFLQKPCELDVLSRVLWDRASVGRAARKRAQWS